MCHVTDSLTDWLTAAPSDLEQYSSINKAWSCGAKTCMQTQIQPPLCKTILDQMPYDDGRTDVFNPFGFLDDRPIVCLNLDYSKTRDARTEVTMGREMIGSHFQFSLGRKKITSNCDIKLCCYRSHVSSYYFFSRVCVGVGRLFYNKFFKAIHWLPREHVTNQVRSKMWILKNGNLRGLAASLPYFPLYVFSWVKFMFTEGM